jgi:hypothetical protein
MNGISAINIALGVVCGLMALSPVELLPWVRGLYVFFCGLCTFTALWGPRK